ncbi:MAG TPA: ABC transporter ATP-binding protein [Phycisphaerae bacterium]|nr:ABC transporter ATP-binding protein [Phycisphaerae bacterium]HOJ75650.1 ABC transporter ATP-binding protein [Phycisphaerae bacterium]HOM52518.1 ABC transporter ATP-binding protein [Phycisphaerae bacterium]HON66837.1 ABC transporter ATP-binding protein [Phycisphaerae bacterium]HOQ87718.1 ABC transporter ATP-binding protein [Phycisphaerae bacterium]
MVTHATPVVQAIGLTKVFKDFWHRKRVLAVDRLDLDIYRNEVFGLLGPNGSGKTTTIKMLLGLLYPTRGRISVLDRPPTDVEVKARIGYLPEESYLYRFLDARETLDYYGRLFQIPRQDRRRRVEQLLEMVGLTRQARRRVGEYSKGMARRIGLAQALINDPELLILDEPTTGLDPIGTREIKDLIVHLRNKGKTILLCSHLLADVEDVCQRVVVLYGGKRQAIGETRELLRQQNLTQITTERLSEETIARIQEIVEREAKKQVLSITTPSDRLESFFLRIVREAQEAQHETSGAASSGQVADFLKGDGEALIDSLVAAGKQAEAPAGAAPVEVAAAPEPAAEVIDELLAPRQTVAAEEEASQATPSATRPAPAAPNAADEQLDRSVIEGLLVGGSEPPPAPPADSETRD